VVDQKLRRVSILAALVVAVLLTMACRGWAASLSPEPATVTADRAHPTEGPPTAESIPTPDETELSGDETRQILRHAHDNDIKFERVSLEQGLSDSTVFCMLQDSQGFMWFGTHDGLNKYDGYDFEVYRHDPEALHSLSNSDVRCLHEDQSGTLWIGTNGGGLNRLDRQNERFIHYQSDPDNPHSLSNDVVKVIYEDRFGVLWIGTEDGLNRFDRKTAWFIRYRNVPNDLDSLSHNSVTSIYEDQSGVLWVGTFGGGLNAFDRDSGQFVRYQTGLPDPSSLSGSYGSSSDPNSLSSNFVTSIYEDRVGRLWIGTWGGLSNLDREAAPGTGAGRFTHYQTNPNTPTSLGHNYVLSIHEDQSGVLWIGTGGGGLDRFDPGSGRFIHYKADPDDPHSLSNDRVWSTYQDQSGVLWVGTGGGGLNKFYRETQEFVHYRTDPNDPHSLSHNNVLAIYEQAVDVTHLSEDQSGVLWIGTGGGGLNKFDRETGQFTHYQNDPDDPRSLSHNTVASIYKDRSGVLWVGTFGGLNRFEQRGERFILYQNDPDDPYSLGGNSVRAILEDQSGVLWIGTGSGLDRFDRKMGRFTHYRADPNDPHSLSHNNVLAIYEDRSGVLWIGTFGGGLNRFDRDSEEFTHYQTDPNDRNSLSDNNVASIHEDRSGVLWIGTFNGGLNRFDRDTETFTRFRCREEGGLPSDAVYGILEDEQGRLWLSTSKGLSKFDPRTETFRNYDVRNGLQGNEFNGGAYHRSSSGEMFFGGTNGFNAFYPRRIRDNPYVPPIVITSLTPGGGPADAGGAVENVSQLTLSWPNNFFEFEFAALSYVQPEKNQYAYILEGFEEDWNTIGTRRFGRYTNIPGGTYTLRIRGSNNDGIWNVEGTSVDVTVVPPFWETWWFMGIAALLLVGGAIGGYRLRVKRIETRSRELERQVAQRTYEIERRRQVAEGLREILLILNSDRSLEESLDYIVSQAAVLTNAEEAIVFRSDAVYPRDRTGPRTVIVSDSGGRTGGLAGGGRTNGQTNGQTNSLLAPAADLPAFTAGWITRPILQGESLVVPDVESYHRPSRPLMDEPVAKPVADSLGAVKPVASAVDKYRALLGVPLYVNEETYGGLVLFYVRERSFSEEDLELGFTFADQAALAIANAQLRDRAEQTAVETERSRLARDLHDAVTQTLFSASLIGEALPTVWEADQSEGRQLLKEMRRLSRGALAEMRTLLLELRPTVLVEASLGDLLHQLAEAVTGRKDIDVTVTVEGKYALPTDVHVALYRIAQEALNNVVKHAHASQVMVSLCGIPPHVAEEHADQNPTDQSSTDQTPIDQNLAAGARYPIEGVELRVSDDGRGFDLSCVPPDRLGLGIIRERAQAIGAALTIESQPGHGTQVLVVWKGDAC
jgi:ligand-binding sensor domain-containing protein/signal transduction histidine kinase